MNSNYIQLINIPLASKVEEYLIKPLKAFGTGITKDGKIDINHLHPSESFELLRELEHLRLEYKMGE